MSLNERIASIESLPDLPIEYEDIFPVYSLKNFPKDDSE